MDAILEHLIDLTKTLHGVLEEIPQGQPFEASQRESIRQLVQQARVAADQLEQQDEIHQVAEELKRLGLESNITKVHDKEGEDNYVALIVRIQDLDRLKLYAAGGDE